MVATALRPLVDKHLERNDIIFSARVVVERNSLRTADYRCLLIATTSWTLPSRFRAHCGSFLTTIYDYHCLDSTGNYHSRVNN